MSALAQQFPIDDSVAAAAAYMRDRLLTSRRLRKERPVTARYSPLQPVTARCTPLQPATARCTPLHPVTLTLP